MEEAITSDCLATDMADELVKKGFPFRKAYSIVASEFASYQKNGAEKLKMDDGPLRTLSPEESVEARDVIGGTSRARVEDQLRKARKILNS